ncbi:multiple sugar transport system permease protein [Inquilinus ginsengisoli]|uniref:Multiple sugar transport system permease protein n=1 Tax=Inquilinus ginsengisoli TaxID=363840 RepID=A0ABU1JWR2_9PROT|nr:sugar ABC transporter permease [Inquilinus ginsengisoli]MDR6293050.1 multiple sugar transport system permease protein [Inquilinus ginsengisoli]
MNTATHAIPGARPGSFRRTLGNALEPWLYLSPALILLTVSLLVPLIVGLSYAFQDFGPFKSSWVGLKNFQTLLHDANFWRALKNTAWWTVGSLFFQFFGGLGLAMLLNRPFRGKRLVQALVFLPWAVPTFLSGLVFAWLFNPVVGPLPYWLAGLGILPEPFNILSDPDLAMWGPILANVWFGIPFFAITLLAALQAIPSDFYEAAAIDGATAWQRFTKITIPFLAPTIAITVLLRTIWIATFADLIWVMTNGGPANSTSILSTYIFAQAFTRLDFGYASAIATVLLLLLLLYAGILIRMRKSLLAGQ